MRNIIDQILSAWSILWLIIVKSFDNKSCSVINDHHESKSIEYDQSFFPSLRWKTEPRILFLYHQSNHYFMTTAVSPPESKVGLTSADERKQKQSDWLDFSLFRSCTSQAEKTGPLICLLTG